MILTITNENAATGRLALMRGRVPFLLLLMFLLLPAFPGQAQLSGKLLGPAPGRETATQPASDTSGDVRKTQEAVNQQLKEVQIRQREMLSTLAAKNPPSYASFDEISARKFILLSTRIALETWLNALNNIQADRQAEQDLESQIQGWSGFGMEEPYPLSLADQLAAEIRAKHLELQTEQARTALEEDQVPGLRKALELTGPKVRRAAEALEQAGATSEARGRWLLGTAEDEQKLAEARLQASLANLNAKKLRLSLLAREIDFLEEKFQRTSGKTTFTGDDLDSKLKAIADSRELLQKKLAEAERANNQAQEQVTNARASLEKDLAAEGRNQQHLRQLLELRQVEAGTASQRVETLKLLLTANSLESILWQQRFRVHQGLRKTQDLAQVIRDLDHWRKRIIEINDYYTSRALLTRTQIQTQEEALKNWPAHQPGKLIEQAKRDAYQTRMNDLEQLIASSETLDFLASRLQAETAVEKSSRSVQEQLQVVLAKVLRRLSSVWNYEIFSVSDTIIADGKVISGSRPVTLKKLIYGLLLLTLGIWGVGRLSKILSHLAERRLKVERSLILLFEKLGYFLAVLTVVIVALGLVQIPVTAFAFLGGALAIGVGFGGQNLINNFMSSLILLVEKPIKVGDVVEAEGVLGRVTAIGGRCSTIRRFDGVDMLVPNSQLLEKTVVNRTHSDNLVRYDLKVGVAYGSPTREVFQLLGQVVDEYGLILKDPKPVVLLEDFAADALLFGIYYWIEVNERQDVRVIASDLRHRIDRLFRDAGISIAFPQRDVHLDTASPLQVQMVSEPPPEGEPSNPESPASGSKKQPLEGDSNSRREKGPSDR